MNAFKPRRFGGCLGAALALLVGLGHAAEPLQHFVASAESQRMEGADGGSLRATWIGAFPLGVLALGASRTTVGDDGWSLMTVGAVKTLPRGWQLAGNADYGPATLNGNSATFSRAQARLISPPFAGMTFRVQDTFVDVEPVSGHLFGGGLSIVRSARWLDLEWSRSVSGNLDQSSFAVRFDYRAQPPYLMVGASTGKSNNRLLLNLPGTPGTTSSTRQAFIGLTYPIRSTELTVSLDRSKTGGVRRVGVSVALRLPIGEQGRALR